MTNLDDESLKLLNLSFSLEYLKQDLYFTCDIFLTCQNFTRSTRSHSAWDAKLQVT